MLMLLRQVVVIALFLFTSQTSNNAALFGYWKEPTGSVIRIAPCSNTVCATLVAISPNAPEVMDKMNPDPTARSRPLCGLVIGKGFRLSGETHAEGGTLYDPKSGKTYHGTMTVEAGKLELHGYVGFKIFGRTETWSRTSAMPPCAAK